MKKLLFVILLVLAVTFSFGDSEMKNIVDTAVGAGNFNTLVAAIKAADLVDVLSGPGPFTVFAPTDEAFDMLPAGTLDSLLNDIPALTRILTYHVVKGEYDAATVITMTSLPTVEGSDLPIMVKDGKVMVGNATVITTDIMTSNGIIHVVDSVIMPPERPNIVELAIGSGVTNTLVEAVKAAGLVETLSGDGPFTVFAPTDEAFAKLPEGTLEALLADKEKLTQILLYHVVSGIYTSDRVVEMMTLPSLQGQEIKVTVSGGKVMVDKANVIAVDIMAVNGVIHLIDEVILPE